MKQRKIVLVSLCLSLLLAANGFAAEAPKEEARVADASEMTSVEEVLEDWMSPIPASELNEGVYDVKVNCSSSMFPITSALLVVGEEEMSAVLTMGGTGYLYVYPGTGLEAVDAPEEDYIPFVEDSQGSHTYTIPVEALDDVTHLAAFSKNKEKWYDRELVFVSTSLPSDAFVNGLAVTTAEELGLEDGDYLVEATLSGGSGKATIESPAQVTVEDGQLTLQVVFSSKNYDYVLVDGEKYETVNTEGNSTFLIPAAGFDGQLPIVADTVAMSKPHEIDYTIFLDSATIEAAQ